MSVAFYRGEDSCGRHSEVGESGGGCWLIFEQTLDNGITACIIFEFLDVVEGPGSTIIF